MFDGHGIMFGGRKWAPPAGLDARAPWTEEERIAERRRARAMVLAVNGAIQEAFGELDHAWSVSRPCTIDAAADLACLYLLAGDAPSALAALTLGSRGRARVNLRTRELVAACVAKEPQLWRRALGACFSGGTFADRMRAAGRLVLTRLGLGSGDAHAREYRYATAALAVAPVGLF
jgi:hypothetical protein